MNLHLIKPTVHVVDRKSKNNVVGISIISRCPSLSRCLVLPHRSQWLQEKKGYVYSAVGQKYSCLQVASMAQSWRKRSKFFLCWELNSKHLFSLYVLFSQQALCIQPFMWYKTKTLESQSCTGTIQTKEITINFKSIYAFCLLVPVCLLISSMTVLYNVNS